ncbi:hypothetical protein [Sphingomonas sp. CFBP 13720]|uniref:hypothetical protein n=1 Tax=Sphingomonas sp. CFBP 13720 TaxID=2775302 RepID=UPI00177D7A6F|nr:hypothetical protein [Sphingomonas sp. CFBP 13720]MBD8678079.1 hypothetical protein [Sphingomonas sp. CFBP 13720]
MNALTTLERTALDAIFAELVTTRTGIEQQLAHAEVLSRENTGGGFFTALAVPDSQERLDRKVETLGENVWLGIEGLEYGLGMLLHFKDGHANLLEGYAVGGEDTSATDFANVGFALIKTPGRLPADGS